MCKKNRFNQKCVTQTVISSHASLSLWPGWFAPLFLSPLYIAMLMDFVVVVVCCLCVVVFSLFCGCFWLLFWAFLGFGFVFFLFFLGGVFLVRFCPVCVSVRACVYMCANGQFFSPQTSCEHF